MRSLAPIGSKAVPGGNCPPGVVKYAARQFFVTLERRMPRGDSTTLKKFWLLPSELFARFVGK